jgi:gas vesicle protein GvpA/GvpJ/GvpM family
MAEAPDYRLQNRRHLEQRGRYAPPERQSGGPSNLADILERVLDKGIVIAGDIQINLLDIELLTIKIRLLVASVDRAKEMGINWWESDPTLTTGATGSELEEENKRLRERLERLEQAMGLPGGESAEGARELPAGAQEGQAETRGGEGAAAGGGSRGRSSGEAGAADGGAGGRRAVPEAERPEEPAGGREEPGGTGARG